MTEKIKYTEIEYFDTKDKKWKKHSVSSVFHLAIVYLEERHKDYIGLNVGIAIPHTSRETGYDFHERFFNLSTIFTPQTAYLLADNNIKVPIRVSEGYSYNSKMGTSCLFGYITPEIVGPDNPPKMIWDPDMSASHFNALKKIW